MQFLLIIANQFLKTIAVVTYRIFFHPLAKYPGPWLGKITNLYAGYHSWRGDLHVDMLRCHEEYGDFVRYAPNGLLVNTAKGLHGKCFPLANFESYPNEI